jgi:hypothetical protein
MAKIRWNCPMKTEPQTTEEVTMARLTSERIGQVVDSHKLSEAEGNAATELALDVLNMMVERHLSATE